MRQGQNPGRVLYEGANTAYFISGLDNGSYAFVVTDGTGATSAPQVLTVEHQSLSRALWLVALGAVAFLATAFVILRGVRDD